MFQEQLDGLASLAKYPATCDAGPPQGVRANAHALPPNGHRRLERFGRLYGACGRRRERFGNLERRARSNAPVMILGESGSGKELVAATLHQPSSRTTRPFIAVNCGGLPANLIESELFGHERG